MKIALFGTPDFAVQIFNGFLQQSYDIALVVTQPDKRSTRSKILLPPPMKVFADQNQIPCLQPANWTDTHFWDVYNQIAPDICLVLAYGLFIPARLLSLPRLGFVNLHASLLPRYRGAAPVQWALIHGDKQTGLTTFFLTREMDAGDILQQEVIPIAEDNTAVDIFQKMIQPGFRLLLKTVELLEQDRVEPYPQDTHLVSFAPKLSKSMGQINWQWPSDKIYNLWRGLTPWPGCYSYFEFKGQKKKIQFNQISKTQMDILQPGQIEVKDRNIIVGTGDRALQIEYLAVEGKKSVQSCEFLNGYHVSCFTS